MNSHPRLSQRVQSNNLALVVKPSEKMRKKTRQLKLRD